MKKTETKNLDYKNLSIEDLNNNPPPSILEYVPLFMKMNLTGNPLMDEMALWQAFSQQGLIENVDIKESKTFVRKAVKHSLVSIILATILNRGLTKVKIGKKSFLDYRIFIKLPIRLSIFGLCIGFLTFNPMFNHFIRLHYYMNTKYSYRYKRFNEEAEPLIMNPQFYSDPSYSPSEKESRKALYEKVKVQQLQMNMEGKEMERLMKIEAQKQGKNL